MFFDLFAELCRQKGVKPGRAADEIGLSRATVTNWKKNGYTPRGETLRRLAEYFGVTPDRLLGAEQAHPEIKLDDFTYAMYQESRGLTEENKKSLLEMARFFRRQQEGEG